MRLHSEKSLVMAVLAAVACCCAPGARATTTVQTGDHVAAVDGQFTVAVNINCTANLSELTLRVQFDTSVVEIVPNSLVKGPRARPVADLAMELGDSVVAFIDGDVGQGTVVAAGSGVLFSFDLRAKAAGVTPLSYPSLVAKKTDGLPDSLNPVPGSVTVHIPGSAPTVTVDQAGAQADPANNIPVLFDVLFSEPVTGFDVSDVSLGGTATGVTLAITGAGMQYQLQVTGVGGDGTIIPSIPADSVLDPGGEANLASTSTDNTVTYDHGLPSVQITPSGTATRFAPIPFTLTFTEAVSGLAEGDLAIGNGTVVADSLHSDDGLIYTVSVNPTAEGAVTFRVPVGSAVDAAGNGNADSGTATVTYDITPPEVAIGAPSPSATNAGPVSFAITCTGAQLVTLSTNDLTLIKTGTANAQVDLSGSGSTTRTVTLSSIVGEGTLAIQIAAGTASDAAGNVALGVGPSASVSVDKTPPSVALVVGGLDAENGFPVAVRAVFSEAVIGLQLGDVTVIGGSASNLQADVGGDPKVYQFDVTPASPGGAVTVSLPGGAVTDPAGNECAGAPETIEAGPFFKLSVPSGFVTSLLFGMITGATDGVNVGLDVPAPDLGSSPLGYARFVTEDGLQELTADIRGPGPVDPRRWWLRVDVPASRGVLQMSWNAAAFATGAGAKLLYLQELLGESPIGMPLDMTVFFTNSTYADTAYEIALGTVVTAPRLTLAAGWNLVGIPVMTAGDVLKNDADQALAIRPVWYAYCGAFQKVAANAPLNPERGAWVYSPAGGTSREVTGIRPDALILLTTGWNLIAPVSNIVLPKNAAFYGPAWSWDTGTHQYKPAWPGEVLEAGKGYFIQVTSGEVWLDTGP